MLSRDFVRFLRAKGLPERQIIYRHVLRNASVPIITVLGLQFETIGDTKLWVLPNPSGLNANYQSAGLAELFRELRNAAIS